MFRMLRPGSAASPRASSHATDAAPDGDSSSDTQERVHVTIVGAGAAGLTAAFFAAEHGARVTVLERTREAGKKILMSGGSRCNVLPLEVDIASDFHSESSPSAVRAVFASWSLELCRDWLEDPYWGVGLDLSLEEETKKYFPTSNSSREVRDKLVAACLSRGVTIAYNSSVEAIQNLTPPPPPPQQQQLQEPPRSITAAAAAAEGSRDAVAQGGLAAGVDREEAGDAANTVAGGADSVAAQRGDDQGEERRASGAAAGGPAAADQPPKRGKKGKGRGPRAGGAGGAEAAAAAVSEAAAAPTRWLVRLRDGREHLTDKLIVCTGGLSFPAVGTDGTGHALLAALGHRLQPPYPALTPLTGPHPAGEQLAGVSMYGIELSVQLPGAKRPKVSERTSLLFTHRGYSGPAVLDLSHYAVRALTRGTPAAAAAAAAAVVPAAVAHGQTQQPGAGAAAAQEAGAAPTSSAAGGGGGGADAGAGLSYVAAGLPSLRVNWTHEPAAVWDERLRSGGTAQVATLLQRHGLRERLADALTAELGLVGRRVCDIKKAERAALVMALTSYELPYSGHEGYKKAEVTGGGVPLAEVDCATMESRLLPGLFLCGECVDVFGRIGGFNFYWAWVSGRLAGVGAAQGGLGARARRLATSASRAAAA